MSPTLPGERPVVDVALAPADARARAALMPVLIAVTMVISLVSSLGAPLIPAVAEAFDAPLASAQWTLTAALLAGAVVAPTMGRLGDGPHRRKTILVGLTVVLVGCVIAGLASTLPVLIGARAMQGIGLGLAPLTMAAARDHLPAGTCPQQGSLQRSVSCPSPALPA